MGRQFAHDSYALARHLGLTIQRVPLSQLQNADRPSIEIRGRLWQLPGWRPFVQLADGLDGHQALFTLAHECAHALGFENERHADQFAQRFLEVSPDETRWGRASAFKASLLESARTHGGRG